MNRFASDDHSSTGFCPWLPGNGVNVRSDLKRIYTPMRLSKKFSRTLWIAVSIVGVISMIAFTLLPVVYYR